MTMLFEGTGNLLIAEVKDGVPGAFRNVGEFEDVTIEPDAEKEEVYGSSDCTRALIKTITKQQAITVQTSLREWTAENLALAFYGKALDIASDSVTGEALAETLAEGDIARLKYTQVSNVVVNDSDTSPKTLVEGTDYEINSAGHGSIRFIADISSYKQPLTVDYDYEGGTSVAMFTQPAPERWLRFELTNAAENCSPVLVEIYLAQADPVGSTALKSDEITDLPITWNTLQDRTKSGDDALGQFGRIIHPAEAA